MRGPLFFVMCEVLRRNVVHNYEPFTRSNDLIEMTNKRARDKPIGLDKFYENICSGELHIHKHTHT